MNSSHKKLYRSRTDAMVAGVLSGLGTYMDVDPTVIRLIFVLLLLITGIFPFTLLYLIAWIIIPEDARY